MGKSEKRKALIKIAKELDKIVHGVATDDKGEPTDTFIEYLDMMYTEEEADLVSHLENMPNLKTLRTLSKELQRDRKELKAMLKKLAKRGYVLEISNQFVLPTPLFVYDLPFILKINTDSPEVKKLAELSRQYFEQEGYYIKWSTQRIGNPRFRILTISEKIETAKQIVPLEEIYSLIDKSRTICVMPCPCRSRHDIEGIRKCDYPVETCLTFNLYAEVLLTMNDPAVRQLTKEETIELVKKTAELGLVHATDNYQGETHIICSCCEDCCSQLAGMLRPGLNKPHSIARANYIAGIDTETCTACQTCLDRCKFGAINVDDHAIVDEEKCMGCGLCAVTCPSDAITMKRLEREEIPITEHVPF